MKCGMQSNKLNNVVKDNGEIVAFIMWQYVVRKDKITAEVCCGFCP